MASRYWPKVSQPHGMPSYNVLDTLHDLHQLGLGPGTDRGETDTTVAHHDGGDAVVAGGGHELVPADLAVVVGVDVYESGGEEVASSVDLSGGRLDDSALLAPNHCGDTTTSDGYVAVESGASGPVDDAGVADDQIVHGQSPCATPVLHPESVIRCYRTE